MVDIRVELFVDRDDLGKVVERLVGLRVKQMNHQVVKEREPQQRANAAAVVLEGFAPSHQVVLDFLSRVQVPVRAVDIGAALNRAGFAGKTGATTIMRPLLKRKIIVKRGKGRDTRYSLGPAFGIPAKQAGAQSNGRGTLTQKVLARLQEGSAQRAEIREIIEQAGGSSVGSTINRLEKQKLIRRRGTKGSYVYSAAT